MTSTQATRVICSAAALADAEATDFLGLQLETLPEDSEGKRLLIVALAWLSPEKAREWAHTLPERDGFVWREIEKLRQVHMLNAGGREQQEAYNTITALLPPREPDTLLRKQLYYWAVALSEPEAFLTLPEWFIALNSPFLGARLWHDCTEKFWEVHRSAGLEARFTSIGQVVLANRASERDLAILIDFLKTRGFVPAYNGLASSALFQVMGVLETRAPQEMAALMPKILRTLGRARGVRDSILTARVLVTLARLELDGLALIAPLRERIKAQQNHRARHWTRHTARMVRQLEPEPSEAHRLARLLRLLALEKTLESALTRKLDYRTQVRVSRAWRWLQKSDRVIQTVTDPEWRKHFRRCKANLEQKVRKSRKLVHIRALAGYSE